MTINGGWTRVLTSCRGIPLTLLLISMATNHKSLTAQAFVPTSSSSCNNNRKENSQLMMKTSNPLSGIRNLLNKNSDQGQFVPTKQQGQRLLKQLNLTSSTEPKTFYIEPSNIPAIASASLPSIFRLFTGGIVEGYQLGIVNRDPSQYTVLPLGETKQLSETSLVKTAVKDTIKMSSIKFYNQEFDPSCRLIREACSILALKVEIIPVSSKDDVNIYNDVSPKQIPAIEDPNTGVELRKNKNNGKENDIQIMLSYLFKTYGNGQVPINFNPSIAGLTANIAMASRLYGFSLDKLSLQKSKSSDPPELPLKVWGHVSSPFCDLVFEKLDILNLKYEVQYTPRGSANRQKLLDLVGKFQVPYLEDPNTGIELFESQAICEYLTKQYGVYTSVSYL